ncbi:MAG: hypothetical protein KDJ52_20880, partial [Anaerolineae bacterium]|nr:hypothetical protein [Anaerolineae bacterium]
SISLLRWPPVVKTTGPNTIEVIVFGNARWDQIPTLMLGGFFVVAILMSFPIPGQSTTFVAIKVGLVSIFLIASLVAAVWMRSRHTYYRIDLSSGQVQRQRKTLGRPEKLKNYLLQLPVRAGSDCQSQSEDNRDATMRYSTCWTLKDGRRKLTIVHKDEAEAQQFRVDLAEHGCPVTDSMVATGG